MPKRPPTPPQFELYPGWLPSSAPAPRPELPFQRSQEIDLARVCNILDVSRTTVLRLIKSGAIRAYQLAGSCIWRVEYDSVVEYCNRLRVHYGISEDRLLRKPARGRLRDSELLPFPIEQTIYPETVEQRLGLGRSTVIKLIESGHLTGYKIVIGNEGSPWRIYEPSLDRYITSARMQVVPRQPYSVDRS